MELRFNLGNGPIVLRSLQPIRLGHWHRVVAQRYRQDGWLRLDDDEDVATTSPGEHSNLDLDTNSFLGAVPSHLATARYASIIERSCFSLESLAYTKVVSYFCTELMIALGRARDSWAVCVV